MVSKEGVKSTLTNSESDSEAAAAPSTALALQKYSLDSRQVRKRNKALQVRFKDICEAQNEQREAARRAGKPLSYKVAYRKYMTVPARRSIPNVTRSTGVQTSPDLKKRYQTFPFERKKGHGLKHAAAVEAYKGRDNGVVMAVDGKHSQTDGDLDVEPYLDDDEEEDEEGACGGGGGVRRTRALLHTNELSCTADSDCLQDACLALNPADRLLHLEEGLSQTQTQTQSQTLPDRASRVTGPIAWNSLTQVECLDSPSVRSKRKKTLQLNGLQSELPPTSLTPPTDPTQDLCKQIVPMNQDGEVKAQLQAMENLISSSQETIKVLLGVIQELEKGEAHREGLSYRTGQDTANCDTCRNSACIIYSVELDFKLQEDKLQPLMKRLCPIEESHLPALPYAQDPAYSSSTPRRKSKHESKKHARWRLWFL